MAFEDATLFSASVRENVLLGRDDLDVNSAEADAQLTEALEIAQAGFVYDLPDGTETKVGEEGLSLLSRRGALTGSSRWSPRRGRTPASR